MNSIETATLVESRLLDAVSTHGTIKLNLEDGTKISNVKSISRWATGIYYSSRRNAKSFSKSIDYSKIKGFCLF